MISNILFNSSVNFAANCGPLSNITLSSNLCNFYILSLNNLAKPFSNISSIVVTKCAIFNNILQITRITSFPATNSNLVMKLTVKYIYSLWNCHMQVHLSGNNVPMVKPPPNHTSPSSTVATFLTTRLMVVLQSSGYSIFHSGNTPIQSGLPWQSYSCQCLNTETSTWGNRSFTTETPSISYTITLYKRLVVTL